MTAAGERREDRGYGGDSVWSSGHVQLAGPCAMVLIKVMVCKGLVHLGARTLGRTLRIPAQLFGVNWVAMHIERQ